MLRMASVQAGSCAARTFCPAPVTSRHRQSARALIQVTRRPFHLITSVPRRPKSRSCVQRIVASRLEYVHVSDAMTTGVVVCTTDTSVDEALVLLVENKITGLPVVDDNNVVVGVVSDFDLLALDTLGKTNNDRNLFPAAEETWQAFKEFKSLVAKGTGKRVEDVMTKKPICVKADTDLEEATRLLLQRKIRRLPVIDEEGKLVGLLSRGNIIRAALQLRLAEMAEAARDR